MRRLFLIVAFIVCMLIAPTAVFAKGASAATIDGPGAGPGGPIDVGGDPGSGEPGSEETLGRLAAHSGIYAATFGEPDVRLVQERPSGDLGPKHTITWTVPQPDGTNETVVQDLYPYAEAGAVTYTTADQHFFDSVNTQAGWFVGGSELSNVLTAAGLPAEAPAAGMSPVLLGVAAVLGIGALVAVGMLARRLVLGRQRPADALASS